MSKWYYSDYERNRHGPISDRDIAELHANGQLDPGTLVWREGLSQWQPWRTLVGEIVQDGGRATPGMGSGGFAGASNAVPVFASVGPYAVAEARSPYAPPRAPLLREQEVHLGDEIVYAGFWKRGAAYVIDAFIIGLLGGVVGAAIGGLMGAAFGISAGFGSKDAITLQVVVQLVSVTLAACYYGWFYASVQRATPGKMAIGIKVVRGDGQGSSFWRGFARYFAMIPGSLILGIGLLMAGFTERKQALHDIICDTVVVDRWAFTEHPGLQREELGTVAFVILALGGILLFGLVVLMFAAVRYGQAAH